MDMPADDLFPSDDIILWRRVLLSPSYIVPDGNTGKFKVSSGAFDDVDMSVAIAERAQTTSYLLRGFETSGVVSFSTGFARVEQGQVVKYDPQPDDPAHALVVGRKSSKVRRAFARVARWAHRPLGYDEQSLPDPAD
jgi:hypothetical protein